MTAPVGSVEVVVAVVLLVVVESGTHVSVCPLGL